MSEDSTQETPVVAAPVVTPTSAPVASRQPLPADGKVYRVTNRSGHAMEVPIVMFDAAKTSFTKTSIFLQAGGTPKLPPLSRVDWAFLLRNPAVTEHEEAA